MTTRAGHERALESAKMPGACRRILSVIARFCEWKTGVCKWAVTAARIAWLTKLDERTVWKGLARLIEAGWLRVVGRSDRRANIYALAIPGRRDEPKPPALGRFAGMVRGAAVAAVVAFSGGHGPDATVVPRPESYGAQVSTACADPVDEPNYSFSEYPEAPEGIHVLGLDVEPDPDARHVGMTRSTREEATQPRGTWCTGRPPPPDLGPGDQAPYRRTELFYRRCFFKEFGVDPPIVPGDQWALGNLIELKGPDGAIEEIRAAYRRRYGGKTIQQIWWAASTPRRPRVERPRHVQASHQGEINWLGDLDIG